MYFTNFPKKLYTFDLTGSSPVTVTNIFARFSFNSQVLNNAFAFYKYQIIDGETPEIVADKIYNDAGLHWVICLTNNLTDPHFDFPLPQDALERKIIKQYGYTSIANSYADIHHYELEVKKVLSEVDGPITETTEKNIVTLEQYNYSSNSTTINVINNPVTQNVTFYANNSDPNTVVSATMTITSTYKPIYVYDYEMKLNESKREIKILKEQYIGPLTLELERVLNE